MPLHSSRRRFLKNAAYAGSGALVGVGGLNFVSPSIWHKPLALEANRSFWARSQPPHNPPLGEDLNVDVAIIGGGLTGLSAAYYIRKASPEHSVVVLEGCGCGNGASGRNGAMVLTMTADRYMNFSADCAADLRLYELTTDNIRRLHDLSAAVGINCDLQTQGTLQVFSTAAQMREGASYVQRAQGLGMPVELWDGSQVAAALGTNVYLGAFFDPRGGQVHPMKLVSVFKAAAEDAGAVIYEDTRVAQLQPGKEIVLRCAAGVTVRAQSVVLASNAFTPDLGLLRNTVLPLREQVAITRPLSEAELADVGWRVPVSFNDSRTEVYYYGLTADRRIHIGGGGPRYNFNNEASRAAGLRNGVSDLRRELVRVFPTLRDVEFDAIWEGVIDWSLDASPSVGALGKHGNIFYGLGYSGHGVNLTSVFGRIIADLHAGRGDSWRKFPFLNARLDYVPNEPFRWLAAESSLAWYRLTEPSG